MKNFFKPARLVFYILMLLTFFILGLYYAGFVDAGKGQGLAGGAIVVAYGVMFGGIAFVASFFIAHFLETSKIKIINWALLLLVLGTWSYKYYEFKKRDALQEERNAPYQNKNTVPTETVEPVSANLVMKLETTQKQDDLGLGFFKPNFFKYPSLYFYGTITQGKSASQHFPQDSLSLGRDQYGDFALVSAPPWLWPEKMNQPFGIFYFKVTAVGREFITVEGNSKTGQTAILNKEQGQLLYWPEFLLSISTINFLEKAKQTIKIKPLDHAGEVNQEYAFLKPILVQDQWMQVELTDQNFKTLTKGWIRWQQNGKLLISYSYVN